ncbi:MAG: hypothetical protein LBL87_03375 [Ruminococcus sp.]|jgi:hypothetical protein|nr:hypothetical protein [Ruminococcus sp.]
MENKPDKNELIQKKYYFRAMMFTLTLIVCVSLLLFLMPRPDESKTENRKLEPFPVLTFASYIDGSFCVNLTKWFADTVPFRDRIVELSGQIKEFEGIRRDNVKFHGDVNIVATEEVHYITRETVTTAPPDFAEETAGATVVTPAEVLPEETGAQTMEFDNNGIVTVGDRSFMLFGGNRIQGKYYADVLNAYKLALGENVNVYAMVVPTAVEFYLPEEYGDYSNSQKDQIDYIYANLSGVTPVDAYSKLAEHTDEAIYLKTDHHWSQLGAYYASTAFAEALGETPQPLSDYEAVTRTGYVGSLYGYTNDAKIMNSPEDFVYYRQPLPYKTYFYNYDTLQSRGQGQLIYEDAKIENSYGMFIGADAIHTKIVTENKNGKRLCVFKESFGNAVIPELIPYFEEIYVIDIRFFGMSAIDYMKQQNITDVLFINNIFAANTYSLINGINLLRTEAVGITEATTAETLPPEETSILPET